MRDVEIPNWLKGLPLAPEYRPTDTEFADPIAYISKIEKEASTFGICKVIPPLPKPSKKYVMFNLNRSLSKSPELGPDVKLADVCSSSIANTSNETNDGDIRAVFTTRQQELGQNTKTSKKVVQPQSPAVRKQVWQSGEVYTLEQFELKSKAFARCHLGMVKEVSPLVVETLFWEAASDKPVYVEYANDVPGSGFGEPEGSFHYFNSRRKRRRRRTFRRSCGGSSDVKKYLVDMSYNGENIEVSTKNSFNSSIETSEVSASLPAVTSNQASRFSVQKTSNTVNEMEGTAGWKLSNSPWNLQVIARSPGSLTRFMPDDIPGVTSPMVYIGMLFSWFAWHVEDHELHSMNFLHTGSPKTWYAIPGDYAFDFEEVIRCQAYGTNIDRLAALTMLGEKTTLLSPEAVLGSGIPCCRLVQNPGEFVVTFPRAYHVGFSHGFNCGEAANFGTPKWLKVAKEAAVRRAAMNYLPMLSHQQLLYLLTMSFVSRVPRSLLPGARSSRLRDRQKEEREESVKKAFIEDILSQNNLLTTLLGKNSSYHVVLWDLDSLPSPSKVSEPCSSTATVVTTLRDGIAFENKNNQDLLCEMSLYMETMNSLYMDDDDLSDDFQVDSGSLACVACGVLGFPFMSVVQPSERASVNLLQDVGVPKSESSHSSPFAKGLADGLVSDGVKEKIEYGSNLLHHSTGECHNAKSNNPMVCLSASVSTIPDPSPRPEDLKVSSEPKIEKGWCAIPGFLRPRIFCLEHAIQIEDLLHSRGGANILVICHSDFKKMKPHAAVTADQIGCAFRYNEVPLDNASQEDLSFIDLAIDDENHDASGEDWTSKLSINLRHCVRAKKSSPAKSVQHALALGGLFSDATPSSNIFDLKWPSKKSRSKRYLNDAALKKPSDHVRLENPGQEKILESVQMEKVEALGVKSDVSITRKEGKLIHYTRSRLRNKLCGSAGKESSGVGALDSNGCYELQHGGGVSVSSQTSDLLIAATPGVGSLEAQIEDNLLEGVSIEGKASDSTTEVVFETLHEMEVDKHGRKNDNMSVEGFFSSQFIAAESPEYSQIQREINILEEISTADVGSIDNSQGWIDNSKAQCSIQSEGNVSTEEASDLIDFLPSCGNNARTVRPDAQNVEKAVEVFGMNSELLDSVVEQEIQGTNGHEEKESSSSLVVSLDCSPALSKEGSLEISMGIAPELNSEHDHNSSPDTKELENTVLAKVCSISSARNGSKRRKMELRTDAQCDFNGFIKSPCEGLRPRSSKNVKRDEIYNEKIFKEKAATKNLRKPSDSSLCRKDKKENRKGSHRCDLESCRMSFQTKEALLLHKRNRCPHEGCGKKFSSHKYAMLHQRVHDDDRPLKCPWKGCRMSFKWAWARTEHLRVHTGERPYHCKVEGCGLTFRFVSDYSRHRRKTGHYVTSPT